MPLWTKLLIAFLVLVIIGGGIYLGTRTSGSNNSAALAPATTSEPPADTTTPTEEPSFSPAPLPTPSPTVFDVGEPADLTLTTTNRLDESTTTADVAITVQSVRTATVSADGLGSTPKNGLFVVVSVHYQITTGSLSYNPFDFQLELPDGTVYQPENGNAIEAGIDPTLDSGNLTDGQQVAGYIVFDANAPHGTINYKPSDSIFASWRY